MLLVLAVIAMSSTWLIVSRLNAMSNDLLVARRAHNAKVLAQAKQALIGYVAAQANKAGENNPGNLPCPENPGDFANEALPWRAGLAGSNCGVTSSWKVGRFPWRTLGLDQLVDADGEPLWYVVSRNWGVDIGERTVINSSTGGQITVDGVANAAIALIIAPGAAISVDASSGCAAWNQVRSTTGTPDWRNYLECDNASSPADAAFVTTGPSGAFNDQVLAVTATDMLPGIEAAIANRIEREIAPLISSAYLGSVWGLTGVTRVFPYAASFADPSLSTTSFAGVAATSQGLLPVNFGDGCTTLSEPRCNLMAWSPASPPSAYKDSGFGTIRQTDPSNTLPWGTTVPCQWDPADSAAVLCEGEFRQDDTTPTGSMRIEISATLTNVATGLRALHARIEARDDVTKGPWNAMSHDVATTMNADGSATITVGATLPNIDCPFGGSPPCAADWGTYAQYRIRLKVADHRLVAARPRELTFDSGSADEIRPGHTMVGQTSGATARVSKVTVDTDVPRAWNTASANPAVTTQPAKGTLTFYSVSGTFQSGENLQVNGIRLARATSTATDADTDISWFARNEWYRHVYYAVAGNYLWTGSGSCSDTSPVTCLQVNNTPVAADATKQRAILFLMGRALDGQTRPSTALTDYFESAENRNGDTVFERMNTGRTFNDRHITLSKN
jgi:hypothetical protein